MRDQIKKHTESGLMNGLQNGFIQLNPNSIHIPRKNLVVWYDTSCKKSIKSSYENRGSGFKYYTNQICDKSGHGNHAYQSNANLQMIWNDSQNKIDRYLTMDGSRYLKSLQFLQGIIPQPNTIFIVLQNTPTTTATRYFFSGITAANSQGLAQSTKWQIYAGSALQNGLKSAFRSIFMLHFNGANSKIFINSATNPSIIGNAGTNSLDGIAMGTIYDGTLGTSGKLFQLIVYAGIDDFINTKVYNYLYNIYKMDVIEIP